MTTVLKTMLEYAQRIMQHAYAPYSQFKVGACFQDPHGNLFVGCNFENAAYPVTVCAEVGALASLIAAGSTRIQDAVIVSNGKGFCYPCGQCRQMLSEFSSPEMTFHLFNANQQQQTATLSDLLPYAFTLKNR